MINTDKNLILIKGEDQTTHINSWRYENGSIKITYINGKTYPFSYSNVEFYKNPYQIDITNNVILKNKTPLTNIVRALQFDRHTRIYYKSGFIETLINRDISFIKSALNNTKSKNCFNYLKQIAYTISLHADDGSNILGKRYEKIDFIREDSVLSSFINGGTCNSGKMNGMNIVYPFGFNISQKQAVDNALGNNVSIIEGPPGTGKTQTILNIIANVVMRGESVAVVSSNNSATQNVLDKLKKHDIDFIVAYLGNSSNKEAFINTQDGQIPDISQWKLENEIYNKIGAQLIEMSHFLNEMLVYKNKMSQIQRELEALKTEQKYFLQYYDETNDKDIVIKTNGKMKSSAVLKLWIENENKDTVSNITFITKVLYFFKYGITNFKLYNNPHDRLITVLQKNFYKLKINELTEQIKDLSNKINDYDFDDNMKHYTTLSMQLFCAKLAGKYSNGRQKSLYELDDLWKNPERFINDYPVILSTTYSLRSSLSSEYVYDYVIIDEASQVDLATGALALSCARKAVIVGDLKQLPNVVNDEMKKKTDEVFTSFSLEEAYRFSNHSLLLSVSEVFRKAPRTLLREHYRCHPKIIEFCNQRFYNNQLSVFTETKSDLQPLMVYKTAIGKHSRDRINQRQIDVILNEVIPQQRLNVGRDSIGIVTPYRNQTKALQEVFQGTNVRANTVDKFQGQECDTIIISTVDDEISEFSDDPNRLNVAVSRAINQLIVVTDGNPNRKDTNIGDLIGYIQYNNYEVIQSEIYSVFDYLYKSHAEKRFELLKKQKIVSEFDSENLMYGLIREVLNMDQFMKYDVVVHVPLNMILRDLYRLDDVEKRYAMNSHTHIDFLLYAKLNKQPILAIEVDGYYFHKEGTNQAERDQLKNVILEKYKIPLIRFKTNESSEKKRLILFMESLLKGEQMQKNL
jgi:superfamily I DNA and/or RNA helicase